MLKTDQEYRNQIKQVGKYNLKDTHRWRERAIYFQEYGNYEPDNIIPDTKDWDDFWDEEERRIMEGLWIDGFYIPGLYYLYLNYLPIYQKQLKKYEFPDVYDSDYHTFLCLEHAIFLKQHFVVIKKRQSGFTLKFCTPLIREQFFGRGSPNYIATYEEAQVKKTWMEVLEPYREHMNTHTPWYRDFNPSKPLDWRAAKEVIDEFGRKLIKGRKNTLKGLILSKSASKGVGGSGTFIFCDEAGVNPVLSKFVGYVKPMIEYGDVVTGTIIVSGAVGELKHLEGGLKEYIINPRKYKFYVVDNIWDKDNEFAGRKCGFFVPESWAYFGVDRDPNSEFYGQPFIDEHGNSFVERAEEYIKKKRLGLIPDENIDEEEESISQDDKFDISQKPLTLAECFQYRGENIFPLELLNPQIEKVERRELHGVYVDLYETQSKEIKHKILDKYTNKPILEHPIDPKRKDKEGVIQVWEFPPSNRATYGVYWAGVDIVKDAESINSPSLNVIHIYKGAHDMEGEFKEKILVAKYMSRPKDKMEWFEKAIMLMEWYNAEALVENNVNWFIEEAIKIKKQHRIAKTPQWVRDMTPQGTSYQTKPFGVVMTAKLMEKILDAISKYLKEPLHTEYDVNTGEPTVHYGIERINDLQLLRELVNYKPKKEYEKGNYDSCFLEGTKITVPTGYKNIETFKVDDEVINHKGELDKVIEIHKNFYKGKIYEITLPNQFNKIICTEEHPILTADRHYRTQGRWWKKFRSNMQNIVFKEVKNITKNNYVFLPKKKNIIKTSKFSKEELYILGWYLGDGHISMKNKNQLRIFLSMDQEHIAKDLIGILNKLDPNRDRIVKEHHRNNSKGKTIIPAYIEKNKLKPAFYKKHKKSECLVVYMTSYHLTEMCYKYCGTPNNKFIHEDIFTDENNIYFLAGLFAADGSLNNGRNYDGYKRYSCSLICTEKHVIESVREMLYNQGILSTCRKQQIKRDNYNDQYECCIYNEDINKLSQIYNSFDIVTPNKKHKRSSFIETEEGYWLKIKDIEIKDYEGFVYNIGVKNENTYIAENIAVHNCISFGLALLHAEYNEVRGIIPKDIKENKNFSQKNAKLMLRSRFSHSNLKKLLNANNIQ